MNDERFELEFRAWGQRQATAMPSGALRARVLAIPAEQDAIRRRLVERIGSMFGATRLVAAGAIVALFGGLLLAGVVTQPSHESLPVVGATASAAIEQVDPSAPPHRSSSEELVATELLPGVTFEAVQVRPGLFRVLNDGAGHDLSQARSIAMTPDGSIWATEKTDGPPRRSLYRMGEPGSVPGMEIKGRIEAVSADGLLWFGSEDGLHSFDGESWSRIGDGRYTGVSTAADGSVWAIHDWRVLNVRDGAVSMSPRADSLEDVIVEFDDHVGDMLTTSNGQAWIWVRAGTNEPGRMTPVCVSRVACSTSMVSVGDRTNRLAEASSSRSTPWPPAPMAPPGRWSTSDRPICMAQPHAIGVSSPTSTARVGRPCRSAGSSATSRAGQADSGSRRSSTSTRPAVPRSGTA